MPHTIFHTTQIGPTLMQTGYQQMSLGLFMSGFENPSSAKLAADQDDCPVRLSNNVGSCGTDRRVLQLCSNDSMLGSICSKMIGMMLFIL